MKKHILIWALFLNFSVWAQKTEQKDTTNVQLKEVSVQGKKKLYEQKVDRMVFNVENSVQATGGDALDALKITPRVNVQNDQISIVGKSTMQVMVDDRMIYLSGDDLINYLKSIPSANIKSIEVITAPPAKYDAQGNSGILNIKLKKALNDSWNAGVRTSLTQATYLSENLGGNFTYKKNKFSFLADISANNRKNIYENDITYEYPTEFWEGKIRNTNKNKNINYNLVVDYQLSQKNKIGILYNGIFGNSNENSNNQTYIYNLDLTKLNKQYDSKGNTDKNNNNHALNLNLIHKIDSLGKQFSVDIDYFINHNNQKNPFYTTNYDYTIPVAENYFTQNDGTQKIDNFSTKIDFQLPYKWAKVELGAKASFTNTKNDVEGNFYEISNNNNQLYLAQKNDFKYKENNQSIYFSAEKELDKKWTAKLGLRAEYTQNRGVSVLDSLGIIHDSINSRKYLKIFPSAYIGYKLNDNHTFSLNYNRRINRPGYWELNPSKWYQNLNSYAIGNPFLQPSFGHNLELNHTYKNVFNSTVYFSKTENSFGQLATHENNTENVVFIRENYFNSYSFGFSENINVKPFKVWTSVLGGNINYMKTETFISYLQPNYEGYGSSFFTNNTLDLNKTKTFISQINFSYNFFSKYQQFTIYPYSNLDISFKYLVLDKKLQMTLLFNNVLGSDRALLSTKTQGVSQSFRQYYDSQFVRFSLNYKFGSSKVSVNQRQGGNSEEKQRSGG
jgi:outer membrane receptor protein involved in Fe transport